MIKNNELATDAKGNRRKRFVFYWANYAFTYIFPFVYFFTKMGITKSATKLVMPVVLVGIFGVMRLARDLPSWISTWEPSFKKGIIQSIPRFLLFIVLITLGLALQYVLKKQIELAFYTYFETVLVLFGGGCVGAFFQAYHLKYKELDLLDKGYVKGTLH